MNSTMESITFKVSDNGCGVAPDKKDLLFKPFSQVSSHYARRHGGTGLALAICKKIVEGMGGSVSCHSEGENKGATFTVELKAAKTKPPATFKVDYNRLRGTVHLLLPDGPTHDVLTTACNKWSLVVRNNEDYLSSTQDDLISNAFTLLQEHADGKVDARGHRSAFVLDAGVYAALVERRPDLVQGRKNLIVTCYRDDVTAVQKRLDSKVAVLVRPVKVNELRSMLEALVETRIPKDRGGRSTNPSSRNSPMGSPRGLSPAEAKSENLAGSAVHEPAPSTALPAGESVTPSVRRILVADDHIASQKIAGMMLRKVLGKEIVIDVASNGQEAFEKATDTSQSNGGLAFDIIFMDVQMPTVDGLDATKRIREWETQRADGLSYQIVAMTQADEGDHSNDETSSRAAGMDCHVSKPVKPEGITRALQELRELRERRG